MNGFLNIGNKAFVNVDKIICIMAADSHKVYRILERANLKRKNPEVIDTTSDNETRSIIFSTIIITVFQVLMHLY